MTYVSTTQELNTALANVNVKKIVLNNNLTADFNATRKVDFDLNGKTFTGNVSYDTDAEGTILLSNGTVTGNLTVDTPNVSFTNSATVNGTTTIIDVANNTFTNNGLLNIVIIKDATGTPRFINGQNSQIQNLVIDTVQPVNLQGGFTKVTVKQDTQLNLANGSVINDLNTDAGVQASVSGGTVETTTGEGEAVVDTEAMGKINSTSDKVELKEVIETSAQALQLDLTSYDKLYNSNVLGDEGQGDRQMAVITDVLANRNEEEPWTIARFKELFNAAVENRTATQDALVSVNSAEKVEDLDVNDFIGKVAIAYEKNQEILPLVSGNNNSKDVVIGLKQAIADFNKIQDTNTENEILVTVFNEGKDYTSWSQMAQAFFKAMPPVQSAE